MGVPSTELKALTDFKATDDKVIAETVNEAVSTATRAVHASEGTKYSSLKNSTDNTIALLKNDNDHLNGTLKATEARVKDLEAKLALVPSQIKEAVAAAKADVITNVDAKK